MSHPDDIIHWIPDHITSRWHHTLDPWSRHIQMTSYTGSRNKLTSRWHHTLDPCRHFSQSGWLDLLQRNFDNFRPVGWSLNISRSIVRCQPSELHLSKRDFWYIYKTLGTVQTKSEEFSLNFEINNTSEQSGLEKQFWKSEIYKLVTGWII